MKKDISTEQVIYSIKLATSEIKISNNIIKEAQNGLNMEFNSRTLCEAYITEKANLIAKHTINKAYWQNILNINEVK